MAEAPVKSKWQDAGFNLHEALRWVRAGVTDPLEAKRLSGLGTTPATIANQIFKKETPQEKKKKYAPIKGHFIVIHITKVLNYSPLSKKVSSSRHIERSKIIDELSKVFNVPQENILMAFARYVATVIRERVKWAVSTQNIGTKSMRFAYAPLSPKYKRTKNPLYKDHFWINSDFLIKNLKVWKYKYDIYVGYTSSDIHPESKRRGHPVTAANILGWLEHGTKNIPARPLFGEIVKTISRNIHGYWSYFSKQLKSKNKLFLSYVRSA